MKKAIELLERAKYAIDSISAYGPAYHIRDRKEEITGLIEEALAELKAPTPRREVF